MNAIVFRPRRTDRARKCEHAIAQFVVRSRAGRVPIAAVRERFSSEFHQRSAWIGIARIEADVLEPPIEGHDAAVGFLRETHLFVRADPLFEPGHEGELKNIAQQRAANQTQPRTDRTETTAVLEIAREIGVLF